MTSEESATTCAQAAFKSAADAAAEYAAHCQSATLAACMLHNEEMLMLCHTRVHGQLDDMQIVDSSHLADAAPRHGTTAAQLAGVARVVRASREFFMTPRVLQLQHAAAV